MQLTLSGVTYAYPSSFEPILDRVSIAFPEGWTGLLGDNGCGKTTLAKIACGLIVPDAGSVSPHLASAYCAQETDDPPAGLFDFAADFGRDARALRVALGIEDDMPWRYDELSFGERKKLQVACALWQRPDVLVLDEPTAGLDPAGRDEIFELVRSYHKQSGATILIVSHSMEDIAQIADRLLVMNHAKVLFCDAPREVFSHADEIIAAGLDIPMITKVMLELKKRGHDVDTSVYTVAQAMDALRACKRKEAAHEC